MGESTPVAEGQSREGRSTSFMERKICSRAAP